MRKHNANVAQDVKQGYLNGSNSLCLLHYVTKSSVREAKDVDPIKIVGDDKSAVIPYLSREHDGIHP